MIVITDPQQCCGCEACVQTCPKQCISFDEDAYGFRYPTVNPDVCIQCGRCTKVCPMLNASTPHQPATVYAMQHPAENIRQQSSSGGIFTLLAQEVFARNGVVFGARFNSDWEVVHDYAETMDALQPFMGSKYVQSRIGMSFVQAKDFLKSGRWVLFSGTSCQIAGLRRFLGRDYDRLLTIDVVCHGVPSPLVWRKYLEVIKAKSTDATTQITHIAFRDKATGWKKSSLTIKGTTTNRQEAHTLLHERCDRNVYMRLFHHDLTLRPSCFNCPAKEGKAGSDFTLADFWGIAKRAPELDDDKGTSMVMVNTEKAASLFANLEISRQEIPYSFAVQENPSIVHCSSTKSNVLQSFWKHFNKKEFQEIERIIEASIPLKLRWNLLKMRIKQALRKTFS